MRQRFVLCGLSRLTVRVAQTLTDGGADVRVVRLRGEGGDWAGLLPPEVVVSDAALGNLDAAMTAAQVGGATCLLALSDDDLDNIRASVAARAVAPDVPVVLRAFDPTLADQLEDGLNVRRAFSVSALAAPAFVAAACGDDVLETMRMGDGEAPICRLTVRENSPLIGLTNVQVKERFGVAVIARAGTDGVWSPVCGDGDGAPLAPNAKVLLGGPLVNVLTLVARNVGLLGADGRQARRRVPRGRPGWQRNGRLTRLPAVATTLVGLLLIAVGVFAVAMKWSLVNAVYFVVATATTTGYGDLNLQNAPGWLKLFGCLVMLCGGALLGVLFTHFAALATQERLDEVMGRRAERMSGHVVVAGLGNLGYRVARQFAELGLDVVALELAPDARFVEAIRGHRRAAVLTGDARLPENLARASISQASAFVACTNDDLVNVQACLHAHRLNPNIVTVARMFDDTLAARLTDAFEITQALSASRLAVGAFVGAASDERALRRIQVDGLELLACRYAAPCALASETIIAWRAQGVRMLASAPRGGSLRPPAAVPAPLAEGEEMILCGPAEALRRIVAPH